MSDPLEPLLQRDRTIRERLAALWEQDYGLRWFWRECRGPIIASIITLAVMVAVLLLTYRLV